MAIGYNKITLIGNLTKNPEVRYTAGDDSKSVCNFRIAVNTKYGNVDETLFQDCTIWGIQAENLSKYKNKGDLILVEGRLKETAWGDGDDKKYKKEVIATTIQYLGKNKKEDEDDF